MNILVLHVIFLNLQVYAWELPGVAGNSWNGEPGCSIAIGSSCIWDKFIFLATRRLGDCLEMLLECLKNPRYRLGIVTGLQLVCGRWSTSVEAGSHGSPLSETCEEATVGVRSTIIRWRRSYGTLNRSYKMLLRKAELWLVAATTSSSLGDWCVDRRSCCSRWKL
eukprot:Gb_20948 [translate_table: standard]